MHARYLRRQICEQYGDDSQPESIDSVIPGGKHDPSQCKDAVISELSFPCEVAE